MYFSKRENKLQILSTEKTEPVIFDKWRHLSNRTDGQFRSCFQNGRIWSWFRRKSEGESEKKGFICLARTKTVVWSNIYISKSGALWNLEPLRMFVGCPQPQQRPSRWVLVTHWWIKLHVLQISGTKTSACFNLNPMAFVVTRERHHSTRWCFLLPLPQPSHPVVCELATSTLTFSRRHPCHCCRGHHQDPRPPLNSDTLYACNYSVGAGSLKGPIESVVVDQIAPNFDKALFVSQRVSLWPKFVRNCNFLNLILKYPVKVTPNWLDLFIYLFIFFQLICEKRQPFFLCHAGCYNNQANYLRQYRALLRQEARRRWTHPPVDSVCETVQKWGLYLSLIRFFAVVPERVQEKSNTEMKLRVCL